MLFTTCQRTYVKLGNLGNNKADDSYVVEHIQKWSSSYNIYIHFLKNKFAQGECN